jgi:hypothetical protein
MHNYSESLFVVALKEATYFDVDCLMNLFQGADSPVEYWSLMQPDNLRQIIVATEQHLLKICLQYLKEIYEGRMKPGFRFRKAHHDLKPSLQMMSEVKDFISSDLHEIGKIINQYEYSYELFASSRQKYEQGLIRVHGGAATPVMSGGARETLLDRTASIHELTAAQEDFDRRNEQISMKFATVLQKTTIYLEEMQDRTLQIISNYHHQLS